MTSIERDDDYLFAEATGSVRLPATGRRIREPTDRRSHVTDLKEVAMQRRTLVSGILTLASPLVIVCALIAAGSSVWAAERVPFSGSLQVTEATVSQDPGISFVTDGSGGGVASHLGRFTVEWEYIVKLADGTGSGPATYTAANGDEIFTTSVGASEPTATPGVFHIVEIQTITGGTGRFSGAKGSFCVDRFVDLNTGVTSGSFHGTITSPGAAR